MTTVRLNGFIRWLEKHEPNAVVGVRNSKRTCPLSYYLQYQGIRTPIVGYVSILDDDDPSFTRDTPAWAIEFMRRIDTTTEFMRIDAAEKYITARDALSVLDLDA